MAVYPEVSVKKRSMEIQKPPSLHVNYMITCIRLLDKRVYSEDKIIP